jgi:alkylated DNA repair protein (DNA oxidative demethylase)
MSKSWTPRVRNTSLKNDRSSRDSSYGNLYKPYYLSAQERTLLLEEIKKFRPIWEKRFSKHNPPPEGQTNRQLLRPVYWLGSWQFACLNYYHPPKGTDFRCVHAEPFPNLMQKIVDQVQEIVHNHFLPKDIPKDWHLNTCLINYYGESLNESNGKTTDVARVGDHRDYEPGPVASLSFGDRAIFQFVRTQSKNSIGQVASNHWLEDSSLQIFGGEKYKKHLFHRVQRVENKFYKDANSPTKFDEQKLRRDFIEIPHFRTRRLNLTFRYVPIEHIYELPEMPAHLKEDIMEYVSELGVTSNFWRF